MAETKVFPVKAPNGKVYPVRGPADATDEELIDALVKQVPEAAQAAKPRTQTNMPTAAQAAITAGQGATFNLLDEMAGGAVLGQLGQSYLMGGTNQPPTRADYTNVRDVVRGGQRQFAEENPMAATGTEIAGALSTLPLTISGAAIPAGANLLYRGYRAMVPVVGQSALSAAGASEAEDLPQFREDVTRGTLEGTMYGGGTALGMKGLGIAGRHIGPKIPKVGDKFEKSVARERLAQLLQRDMEARIMRGDADPVTIAEARLRKLGPSAPLAATGESAAGELGLLRNQPGSAKTLTRRESRRIEAGRGPALVGAAEEALDAQGVPFRATAQQFSQQAKAKSEPFYAQLRNVDFDIDPELANIISRARKAFPEAEELAMVSGMPVKLDLGNIKPGDRVPFDVLDNLKRTLYDVEEAAKGEFGKPTNKSRVYTNLRRDLINKLDNLSPKDASGQSIYRQARSTFEGETALENAMKRGRDVINQDVEELGEIVGSLEPAQLEAFRLGAAQAIRDKAGTPSGQTQLLSLYKSPVLQSRLRIVFGNDFKKFQKAVLQQEELRRVSQAGQGSQTYSLMAGADDQNALARGLQATRAAQGDTLGMAQEVAQQFSRLRMPEASRNQLARMLLQRGEPAMDELRDMRKYMERRRLAQALGRQSTGRVGAITAQE
jgi:hypothetical protein